MGTLLESFFFFYAKTKIQLAFRTYLVLQFKNLIGTILPGGSLGGAVAPPTSAPPQCVDPLSSWLGPAAAAQPKSCFKSAENRAASSLGVGGHRYTRILCASKLLWEY